jgi:hypothetical protein
VMLLQANSHLMCRLDQLCLGEDLKRMPAVRKMVFILAQMTCDSRLRLMIEFERNQKLRIPQTMFVKYAQQINQHELSGVSGEWLKN